MKIKGRFAILAAIFLATFMTSVEVTIVTTAMPTIISELHGLEIQSWVFAVYLLISAITTPLYGKLSDAIGRKNIFIFGLALFIIGSFLCGLAPDMLTLIIFRLIQGIGAGAIMPLTFTIIADLFSFEERANILAFNNTAWAISALAGPLLGGWIVDTLSWHWVFFINVPLGLLTIALTAWGYHDHHKKTSQINMDWSGIASLSVLLLSLLMIFQELGASRINWLWELILVLVFFASTYWFIRAEKKAKDPIFQIEMFKNRTFSIQIMVSLLLSGALIGYNIYFPIWLQAIYRVPAFLAGLTLTPSSVMWMVSGFFVGWLMKKFKTKQLFLLISGILTLLSLPLVFASVTFPMFYFYLIAGLMGACMGIILTMSTLIAQNLVPKENIGLASSMIVLGRTLGQAMMTGIFGLAFSLGINSGLTNHQELNFQQVNEFISSSTASEVPIRLKNLLDQVVLGAIHSVFWIVTSLCLLTLIVCCFEKQGSKRDIKE
ncbi:MDR family MFS transporter [Lactococcus fujiensis]|uniref:Multidrug transporter protein n=1 Tax=Lactococcus fujiensis JCM 16395 TaxID=1291764 RepID=A0A2A5RQA5_9LACT|nr:MDR family MFS transporter [Lactococcus fujiensis]PCS01617.1 multidrug transporter protein [Lactococcus fujiensis JCM 16395]